MDKVRYTVEEDDVVKEIHKVVVHKFDIWTFKDEDPDVYSAEPIFDWERSEAGQFVMKYAMNKPEWVKHADPVWMGYRYIVIAELEAKTLSEFYLRFGND
jgi:hypothetical protein